MSGIFGNAVKRLEDFAGISLEDFSGHFFPNYPLVWEVLNGVGVDGVGGLFPFFRLSSLFFVFLRCFPYSPRGQGQTAAIYCKNGEFHSDLICTDPVQNLIPD